MTDVAPPGRSWIEYRRAARRPVGGGAAPIVGLGTRLRAAPTAPLDRRKWCAGHSCGRRRSASRQVRAGVESSIIAIADGCGRPSQVRVRICLLRRHLRFSSKSCGRRRTQRDAGESMGSVEGFASHANNTEALSLADQVKGRHPPVALAAHALHALHASVTSAIRSREPA
jgi:hypothetical protein